jgi:hypothetical protein
MDPLRSDPCFVKIVRQVLYPKQPSVGQGPDRHSQDTLNHATQ